MVSAPHRSASARFSAFGSLTSSVPSKLATERRYCTNSRPAGPPPQTSIVRALAFSPAYDERDSAPRARREHVRRVNDAAQWLGERGAAPPAAMTAMRHRVDRGNGDELGEAARQPGDAVLRDSARTGASRRSRQYSHAGFRASLMQVRP